MQRITNWPQLSPHHAASSHQKTLTLTSSSIQLANVIVADENSIVGVVSDSEEGGEGYERGTYDAADK